ncbi:hypothetical protein JVT61DRAFT_5749 [Boletus reticuloceps]|uniref:UTP23 sensor motif region domain-containing protein n=1 Tax=Boletus reticuloceps TaxID=495285 RepID=A0A8I2YXK9_9AGAM|nr:hypothetical protein JVT61DRAFT_5749 [Boletus reticuloceps]
MALSSLVDTSIFDASAGESNKHRYVVATQSRALRVMLRLIPAVPIVHRNRAVMILEPPSDATLDTKQQACRALGPERAFQPSAAELANIGVDNPPERPRRRQGPKGPNPLSVKKKATSQPRQRSAPPDTSQKRKRTDVDEDVTSPTAQKRKRRRKHGR